MRGVLQWVALLTLTACTGAMVGSEARKASREAEAGNPEAAVQKLERLRERAPDSFDVRLELGVAYYKLARAALDEGREQDYSRHLGHALDEVVEAARIRPASARPHTWMGIIAAYQDDLDGALSSFQNALRLEPRSPVHHLNIAQIHVYRGNLSRARRSVDKARRMGAQGAFIDLVETLAAWRSGDMVEARDLFDMAFGLDPEQVNTWDEAPVDQPIESFADFTSYCCSNHTCGPHMVVGCERLRLEVKQRELRDETLRHELVLEMERRRKLREIYKGRRDLEIQIEPPSDKAPQ